MGTRIQVGIALAMLAAMYWGVVMVSDDPYDPVTSAQVRELRGTLVDRPAPDFQLSDLDGVPHALSDLRGHVVFLNFWATWCPPCIEEMPSMLALANRLTGDEFVMVAVTQDQDPEVLIGFLRDAGFFGSDVLILQDPDGILTRAYGTELLPETYIIDRSGTLVARFMGPRDWGSEAAQRLIQRLLRHPWKTS